MEPNMYISKQKTSKFRKLGTLALLRAFMLATTFNTLPQYDVDHSKVCKDPLQVYNSAPPDFSEREMKEYSNCVGYVSN